MFYVSTALAALLAVRGVATAADVKPETAKPEVVTAAEAQAQAMRTMQASIAKQKEAVRRQFSGARLFTGIPWVGGTATPVTPLAQAPADCDPLGEAQMAPLIASAAILGRLRYTLCFRVEYSCVPENKSRMSWRNLVLLPVSRTMRSRTGAPSQSPA